MAMIRLESNEVRQVGRAIANGTGVGIPGLFQVSGDPNGNTTAIAPAIAYTDAGSVWIKTGTTRTDTGWVQVI